ncbi:MAG: hypothetical protein H0U57_14090 [Tatlockia sp.]|nr:hypothetical protein [Tatlockia sp.]
MNRSIKLLHLLVIFCLVLISLKPLLASVTNKTVQIPQYSTSIERDCSSRTSVVSYCQLLSYFTLTENLTQPVPYLFIVAGALIFGLIQHCTDSPKSRLFKPPITL